MTTFTWTPDTGAASERTPKVKAQRFGDGYEQRQPDGINVLPGRWTLSFSQREYTEIDDIEAFLVLHGGSLYFTWTPPRSVTAGRYICKSWSRMVGRGNLDSLNASFEEVFDSA